MMDAQLRPDSPIRTAKRSRSSDHSPALSSSSEKINKQDDVRLPAFLRQSIQGVWPIS